MQKLRRKKWEEIASLYLGKQIKIKHLGKVKQGKVDSIVISNDKRGRPIVKLEIENDRRTNGIRFDADDCKLVPTEKIVEEASKAYNSYDATLKVLTEKVKSGNAEFVLRRNHVSLWNVKQRASSSPVRVFFDDNHRKAIAYSGRAEQLLDEDEEEEEDAKGGQN